MKIKKIKPVIARIFRRPYGTRKEGNTLADVGLPAFAKFVLVTLAAAPATFLFSYWVRESLRL